MMKLKYDSEADALYIKLIEGEHEVRTVNLTDEIALDFATGEVLVGIEILDAKEVIGKGDLPKVVLENLQLETTSE